MAVLFQDLQLAVLQRGWCTITARVADDDSHALMMVADDDTHAWRTLVDDLARNASSPRVACLLVSDYLARTKQSRDVVLAALLSDHQAAFTKEC